MRIYFQGSTTSVDGGGVDAVGYVCGETIRFELRLVQDGEPITCPLFKWSMDGDDGKHSEGFASGETGRIVLETTLDSPGFVRVIVYACAIDGTPLDGFDKFEGGAGAEIEKLEQGLPEPEGFDEFWASQRAIADAFVPELLEKVRVREDDPDFDIYDVKISTPNTPASGYLAIPKGAEPGSLPLTIHFIGYGVDSTPIECEKGIIRLTTISHSIENGREPAYYAEMKKQLGSFGFEKDKNQSPETCYFAALSLRDLATVKWAKTLPEYDGHSFYIKSGSMGAMRSMAVAANDHDVVAMELGVPWLCDLGGITKGKMRGWRPDPDRGVLFFDTVNNAKRITCPVKITVGLGDYVCPPSGEVVLWKNIPTEKSITFVQNMTHPYRPVEEITYTR
ncbi:MAG: acetylxylan esterase [Clostridia bacterium]|nr:acetylxylan esterase [Clostridia bacterium]